MIAVVLAFFATLVPESDNFPGWEIDRVLLSQAIVGLPLVAAYASTFAAYAVPVIRASPASASCSSRHTRTTVAYGSRPA
ncbi:hypothetical protein [Streptomyces odontomachi]|uniref:hypothetical protein n=1 Tax=Streptomyces odontomachi TaxID=2944940 RepID=UPI00210F12E2|nr:hypothetical protein [Streptomyces sp. ODS25]